MSWLTNFVRPKIRALVKRKDVPDNLWTKCGSCGQMIFHRDLQTNLHVCQNCGHHMRIPLAERLAMLFDEGKFTRIDLPDVVGDPLKFRDDKRYTDRLKEARNKTGETDAAIVA
ncbi:MAG: acetyl-CoA carboxylase carboxyl transferase subunit beta, partial [Pseudomonadota bacterium]|nr:acetyl-CoA carboxylase carboxyl transferase subunit beta [Pseudomonadota bacterium]